MRAIDILRWALFGLAALVVGQASLGFLGLFSGTASGVLAVLFVLGFAAAIWKAGWLSIGRPLLAGWMPLEAGLLAAVAAAIGACLWIAAGRDTFLYDSISFHLYFPASWMDSGRLDIVPMVFGDVAPAYNPSNVELLIHLLMAPLRSSYLAECVQVPFALLAGLAIHATARELGAARAPALSAVLAFLMIPEVRLQASLSMVDLAVGALFLATLPFLIRLWRAPKQLDVISLATAWGLFIGTKFIALAYSAPLVLAAAAILWRHRRRLRRDSTSLGLVALVAIVVFCTGGFWYLRNLLAAGNPIFPLDSKILGMLKLDGLYDSALMRQWRFHIPVENVGELLELLLTSGTLFAIAGVIALAVRWRGPEPPLAIALLTIFWFMVPYQHSRFLFGIFGVVAIALGVAARGGRAAVPCRLLLAVAILGPLMQWSGPGRLAVIVACIGGAALPMLERHLPLRLPVLAIGMTFTIFIATGLGPFRDRYPGFAQGPELYQAWRWVHENVSDGHIAYTGFNLPFPLYGRDLSNRVAYANVSLGPHAKVHDFPVDRPFTTAEPTLYRNGADFDTWIGNLEALQSDTLFISAMFPNVQRNIGHDDEGFPVERAWADAHPETFRLRYATEKVRIYQIVRRVANSRASSSTYLTNRAICNPSANA